MSKEVLAEDAKGILDQFWKAIPWGWSLLQKHLPPVKSLADDLASREQRRESCTRIEHIIERNRDELLREAGTKILLYLERFKVRSDSADPFKIAYWFGVVLADRVGEANDLDKRVVMLITMQILDHMCEDHSGQKMPQDMRSKMDMSIAEGKHVQEFGEHGLYHSMKSLAKAYAIQ